MKISDLLLGLYTDLSMEMPEGADEEDETYAEKRAVLNSKINSSEFLNSQVKFKNFIINNENVNAH